jgi:hypothetical protein
MGRLAPITEAAVHPDRNADWTEKNGPARIAPSTLEQLLNAGKPVALDDKLLDEGSYAPWCRASFTSHDGRKWSLYHGGLSESRLRLLGLDRR